jgi:hypothetical protein
MMIYQFILGNKNFMPFFESVKLLVGSETLKSCDLGQKSLFFYVDNSRLLDVYTEYLFAKSSNTSSGFDTRST